MHQIFPNGDTPIASGSWAGSISLDLRGNSPTEGVENSDEEGTDITHGIILPDAEKLLSEARAVKATQCPAGMKIYSGALGEFERIRQAHKILAPTGCTREFCQSGRLTRILEPRVGRDRPIGEIEEEALAFLQECRDQDVIKTDELLDERKQIALYEIRQSSKISLVTYVDGTQIQGAAGGTCTQTPVELEYGLRASWRNARRCIMRSEHENLVLVDLRSITTSRGMVQTMLKGMVEAFNQGHILPTCFVFPPRLPGKRGAMIWNNQILSFAGYRLEDGSILGDPASVELTESMIEFGWEPPMQKSKWDLLPVIAMAEGDKPYMAELPPELKRTIQITHPRYEDEFRDLDLKWVVAPALSRLGFDIGGNQYTATPFIGWFMDSEIGVRNLADTFRYNALPDVVKRLNLTDEPDVDFQDLPEYKQMVALSRAQAELNFAVYHSYLHENVTMVDTLTSSIEYRNFNQDRKNELGYGLPADPYYLAPPQGSIVPVWHDGGAPNYQPKPMICKHVQDPIKAWRREVPKAARTTKKCLREAVRQEHGARPKIRIFACTAGVNAGKLAHKLHDILERTAHELDDLFDIEKEQFLNKLDLEKVDSHDIILIIASTTGRGEIPRNAARFMKKYEAAEPLKGGPRFSCFANGDSTYGDTYNAAGKQVQEVMARMGCRPLLGHCFAGDTAQRNPDWDSFNSWLENINHLILGDHHKIELPKSLTDMQDLTTTLTEMPTATLVRSRRLDPNGLYHITLDIGDVQYQELDHIKILTPNLDTEVRRVMAVLKLSAQDQLSWHHQPAFAFFSRYVDLDHGFRTLVWYPELESLSDERKEKLRSLKVPACLETLSAPLSAEVIEAACKDMPSIAPKLYSVASSPEHKSDTIQKYGIGNMVDIIVKVYPGGRFSESFLSSARLGAQLRFGLTRSDTWKIVQAQRPDAPFVAFCTGSGIGPIRAVLQRRLIDFMRITGNGQYLRVNQDTDDPSSFRSRATSSVGQDHSCTRTLIENAVDQPLIVRSRNNSAVSMDMASVSRPATKAMDHNAQLGVASTRGSISLFAGYQSEDSDLIDQILRPAQDAGLFDILQLVPSNSDKVRVQDHLLFPDVKTRMAKILCDPSCIVFVCANELAAYALVANLSDIIGSDVKTALGSRYIEEVFRG